MGGARNNPKKLRRASIRRKVVGTGARPRMSVFRSAKNMYVQLIDDTKGATLTAVSTKEVPIAQKTERAKAVGLLLAKKALALKIKHVVFDRGGNAYHGRVAAVAAGAREGGLEF